MDRIRMIFRVLLALIFGLFLHYVLPQHDVVKVTGLSDRILTLSGIQRIFYAQTDAGENEGAIRDLRLINTEKKQTFLLGFIDRDSTEVMVYRNEDTGWIWPPYFKFDSSNLEAEAQAFAGKEQWLSITHYGWRVEFLSLYPNAISVKEVDGPSYYPVPWFNICFFLFLVVAIVTLRAMWSQFRERKVDPLLDQAGDRMDAVQAGVAERRSGISRWLNTWRKKENRK